MSQQRRNDEDGGGGRRPLGGKPGPGNGGLPQGKRT
jgi:hypothetical protein